MKRLILSAALMAFLPLASAGAFQILTPEQMEEGANFDGNYFSNYDVADDPALKVEMYGAANAYDRSGYNRNYGLGNSGYYGRRDTNDRNSRQACASGESSASMTALSYGVVNSYPCQRFR